MLYIWVKKRDKHSFIVQIPCQFGFCQFLFYILSETKSIIIFKFCFGVEFINSVSQNRNPEVVYLSKWQTTGSNQSVYL